MQEKINIYIIPGMCYVMYYANRATWLTGVVCNTHERNNILRFPYIQSFSNIPGEADEKKSWGVD